MPTVSMASLFVLSPGMGKIFPVMLAWTAFMYAFHRFVILRITKKQMYASENLTIGAEFLWGIPLASVAMAWAFWGFRLGRGSLRGVFTVPLMAMLFYFGGIVLIKALTKVRISWETD